MNIPDNFEELMRAGVRVELGDGLFGTDAVCVTVWKSLADRIEDGDVSMCDVGAHEYEETYYGLTCAVCGDFLPDGQGPWVPMGGWDA